METPDTWDDIREALAFNDAETARLSRERKAMELTVEILWRKSDVDRPRLKPKSQRARGLRIPPLSDDIDISRGDSIAECLKLIGQSVANGEVNATQATRLIMRAGKSKSSSLNGLVGTVRRELERNPSFLKVRKGWYQYRPVGLDEPNHDGCEGDCDIVRHVFGLC